MRNILASRVALRTERSETRCRMRRSTQNTKLLRQSALLPDLSLIVVVNSEAPLPFVTSPGHAVGRQSVRPQPSSAHTALSDIDVHHRDVARRELPPVRRFLQLGRRVTASGEMHTR